MSDSSVVPLNGAAVEPPTPTVAPCPLNDLPKNLHQYIHDLEARIAMLETAMENFNAAQIKSRDRLKGLGKIIMSGPAKMFISALPKDRQAELLEFFGGEENREKVTP